MNKTKNTYIETPTTMALTKQGCSHQFFKLTDEIRTKEENMTRVTTRSGIRVMCALCGQQRILWMDGEVEIL